MKKYYRVYYAYKMENKHQEFWIMAEVLNDEKIRDKAWEMLKEAHPGITPNEVLGFNVQEIDAFD